MTLQDLFLEMTSKLEMVVTFLAVLELIRLKLIKVVQRSPFATIEIYSN